MKIETSGQGLELTDALVQYVTKRLDGLTRRGRKNSDRIRVVLGKEGDRCIVQMHAALGRANYDVHTESHDMYSAIDQSKEKLYRVIEDGHDEIIERKRRN